MQRRDVFQRRLAAGHAFVAEAAEHGLLDGAQTGDRPHAADVVDGLDVLLVALTHHAAG